MNSFQTSLLFFLKVSSELVVLFMVITTLVEVVLMYIPPHKLRRLLSGHRGSKISGNILGAALGAITPFCACSTIPLLSGMLRARAPFGSVMSFLIASPLLNPMIIGMLTAFMGWKAALVYLIVGLFNAVMFGWLLERANAERFLKQVRSPIGCCQSGVKLPHVPETISGKLKKAVKAAWAGSLRPVLPYLFVGVAVGAVIYGFMPQEMVLRIAGPGNPLAVPMAALIGVPLYIRVETAIAIGLALMGKGMSTGAAVALVIGGAGMAIPEMSLLAGIFRKRLVLMIVATVFLTAVGGGLVFNMLLP